MTTVFKDLEFDNPELEKKRADAALFAERVRKELDAKAVRLNGLAEWIIELESGRKYHVLDDPVVFGYDSTNAWTKRTLDTLNPAEYAAQLKAEIARLER